jgi:hypothetical protein
MRHQDLGCVINMGNEYVPPQFFVDAFCCPHCGAFAHQFWYEDVIAKTPIEKNIDLFRSIQNVTICFCQRCKKDSIWFNANLIYPMSFSAPLPDENMPEDVKTDYIEAMSVVYLSPRAAAALLRLALEKLMIDLNADGKDLNVRIGDLVKKGLPETLQRAADALRVIGNNAVHPGVLDLKDDSETAIKLFNLLNMIVDYMITKPKEINEIYYGKLPQKQLEGINQRDSKS